jgi:hypothetical protein
LIILPDWPPPVCQPRRDHEAVVHEVPVHPMQRRVLRNVHLDKVCVVQQEAGGNVSHVTAALYALKEVVQLAAALVELETSAGK